MVLKKSNNYRLRRTSHVGGKPDSSICPSLKTQEECVVCKWNAKTSKCGKAPDRQPVKKSNKSNSNKTPKCPSLNKTSCDANPECSWNDKTSKCRKRTVKKGQNVPKPKIVQSSPARSKSKSPKTTSSSSSSSSSSPLKVAVPDNKEFKEMNLENSDFSGMDLKDVFFFSCNLKNAKFQNADLTNAKFRVCQLDGANFSGAKLLMCEFKSCRVGEFRRVVPNPLVCKNSTIERGLFNECYFANSIFTGTTFEGCELNDCETLKADFSECKFPLHTIVRGVKLNSASTFKDCNFILSDFSNVDFKGCDFNPDEDNDFDKCVDDDRDCGNHFNGSVLTGAKFPEKVNMCSFSDAVLTGSDISDPKKDIQGCHFDKTTEAEDVEELKRRAMPSDDDGWNSPVKQKTPSPRVKSPSPIKKVPSPITANSNSKCIRQTQKKYLERPSPPYSASDCPGMVMQGNDGKQYISVANAKGVYTWKLQK